MRNEDVGDVRSGEDCRRRAGEDAAIVMLLGRFVGIDEIARFARQS